MGWYLLRISEPVYRIQHCIRYQQCVVCNHPLLSSVLCVQSKPVVAWRSVHGNPSRKVDVVAGCRCKFDCSHAKGSNKDDFTPERIGEAYKAGLEVANEQRTVDAPSEG